MFVIDKKKENGFSIGYFYFVHNFGVRDIATILKPKIVFFD